MTTNKTTIILDDTFKREVKHFYHEYVEPLYTNIEKRRDDETLQSYIRDDIKKHLLPKLNYGDRRNMNSKANMYVIFIIFLFIPMLDSITDWHSVLNKFYDEIEYEFGGGVLQKVTYPDKNIYVEKIKGEDEFTCACGHKNCYKRFTMGNDYVNFIFGSTCIDKTSIVFECRPLINYTKNARKRQIKEEKEYRKNVEKEERLRKQKEEELIKYRRKKVSQLERSLEKCTIHFGKYKGENFLFGLLRDLPYFIYMDKKGFFDDDKYLTNRLVLKYLDYYKLGYL